MAKLEKFRYPWPWRDEMDGKPHPKVDWEKKMKDEHEALENLLRVSSKLKPDQVVGAVLRWPRGDGYAFYIVTKEKPLTLQWVPYSDAWQVETALIKGLSKADVVGMLS